MSLMKIEEMQVDLSALQAKIRFLTDEAAWLHQAIRAKEDELSWHLKNPRKVYASPRAGYPLENPDFETPLRQEITFLEAKRNLILARHEEVQAESGNLSSLLDSCRRHVAVPNPERHISVVGVTTGAREFSPGIR